MKTKLMILFLLLSLLMGTVAQVAYASDASQFAVPKLVVNTSFLNVRSGPGPEYSVIAIVVGGTELPVLGSNHSSSWYLVSTLIGQGWVDVTFTLPRGDFRTVPEIDDVVAAVTSAQTATSIALPQAFLTSLSSTVQTPLSSTTWVALNVLSVNLRTQPADSGSVITIMFRDDNLTFPVVGYAYDSVGVRWIAIVVPGAGTGWIEEAKTTVSVATSSTASPTTGGAGVIQAIVPAARVVINTGNQNVRYGPGPQFDTLVVVPGGTTLEVIGVLADTSWYKVRGSFGDGWVASEFVLFRGSFSSVPVIHSIY